MATSPPLTVYGTGLVLGRIGVLLRGPSGSGKSLLALALLDRWDGRGTAGMLVADDRVDVVRAGDDLFMQAPHAIAGSIELRGRGIVQRSHISNVKLHLLVDLVPDLIRMPDAAAFAGSLAGLELVRVPVPAAPLVSLGHQVLLVVEAIAALPPP